MADKSVWIVEVDGVPVRMRKDPPEPKPLVGACVVQDVLYVPKAELDAMSRTFTRACEDAKAGPLAIKLAAATELNARLEREVATSRPLRLWTL